MHREDELLSLLLRLVVATERLAALQEIALAAGANLTTIASEDNVEQKMTVLEVTRKVREKDA